MKKLVLGLAMVGFGTFAMAQQQMPTKMDPAQHKAMMEQKRAKHMAEMQKELNLTPAQVSQMNALHEKYRVQREQQKTADQNLRKQKMEVYKKNRQQMDADMKQILTPEQYQKWQAKKQERMQMRKNAMDQKKGERFKKAPLQKMQK